MQMKKTRDAAMVIERVYGARSPITTSAVRRAAAKG
jgi:hypothetical protein